MSVVSGSRRFESLRIVFGYLREAALPPLEVAMRKVLCILVVGTFALGCGSEPRIDTSSDAAMETSIEEVRSTLSSEEKEKFDEALQVLAFSGVTLENLFTEGITGGAAGLQGRVKETLQGKSASEVIAAADSIHRERAVKEREQALQEIAELEEKQAEAAGARQELAKFEVQRSRFSNRENVLGMDEPIIELTVRNGTAHAISRAYFLGTLASPGRSVPWLKETFSYRIRGGLEPGEQASWRLAPNMFSDWGQVDVPGDAILTVEVVELDGPDGETLFSSEVFDEDDAERLAELKAKFGTNR